MEKTISCWGSFHCKKPEVSAAESQGEPPCSEGAEKGKQAFQAPGARESPAKLWCWRRPEWRRLNFDESFFHSWWPWKSCEPTRLHQHTVIHFTSAHQFAYEKHSKKASWGNAWNHGHFCAFGLFRSDNRRSGPTSLCHEMRAGSRDLSTLLVPYCHTAHMCWNQFWSLLFGFLPLPFTLQNMVS